VSYPETVAHPDLPAEQAYVDRAYAALDDMRDLVARAANATDQEVAALALEAWSARRLATFEDAERGLLFGRLDYEDVERPLYIGRRWVEDAERRQLVVNWQAPAARPFYTATPHDPQRVTLRRRFRAQGRRLLDIADETLDGSTLDGAAVADFLLEELERDRSTRMRDIVATIQGDQYRLITHDGSRPLVIQGGPGTGKTAVGLHRASWLLYTHRERLARSRVLVLGPNRTFMEYVSHVLPALGESAVEQRAVAELVDGVEPSRVDPLEVAALKGDARLAEVVRRAAGLRLAGEPQELVLRLDGTYIRVRQREVAELLEDVRAEHGTTAAARERFRMGLVRRFYADYARQLGGLAMLDGEQIEKVLRTSGVLRAVLDRAWPAVAPDKLVRALFTTPAFLEAAADGVLEPDEQRLLRRRGAGWSDADVALLDEANALVGTPPRTFGHVVVDEAQDLTPMQLRMVGRRARDGALTILGDVAQATGPIGYSGWDEVLPYLPRGDEADVEELRHAYRVPREIMELALPLLPLIAPGLEPPLAYRMGAAPPVVRRVEEGALLAEAYREARRLAAEEGLVALIVPDELVEPAFAHESAFDSVPLLTARSAKGLEFDHVIVVEPALTAARPQGLRELYVALTRPTKTLVVLHARPLPTELHAN
jgi:DNA helicase IV